MHNSPAVALFGTIFNEKHNMDNIVSKMSLKY